MYLALNIKFSLETQKFTHCILSIDIYFSFIRKLIHESFCNKKSIIPLIIALTYIIISLVWIMLSDRFLLFMIHDEDLLTSFQGLKGGFFVLVTGILLFYFINNLHKKSINRELVFESILGNAVIGLCEFDTEKIIFSNKVFKKIFEFNENDLRLRLTDLVHHTSVANLKEAIVKVSNGSESESVLVYPLTSKINLYQVTLTTSKSDKNLLLTGIVTKAEKIKTDSYSHEVLKTIIKRLESARNEKQLYYIALEEIALFTNADAGVVFIANQGELIELQRFINHDRQSNSSQLNQLLSNKVLELEHRIKSNIHSMEIKLLDGDQKIGLILLLKKGAQNFSEVETNFIKVIENDLSIKLAQYSQQIRLSQNENQLHQLLESVKISIWYLDCERKELIRSKNLHIISKKFVGQSEHETLDWETFLETIHPDFRVHFNKEIVQLTKREELVSIESKFEHVKGDFLWFLTNAKLFSNEITGKNYIIGITSNINHLKLNDQIIKNSEQTYKDLFESNPASLLIFSVQSLLCIDANESAQFMYGLTIRQLRAKTVFDLMPSEDAHRFTIPYKIVTEYGFLEWDYGATRNAIMI